MDRREKIVLGTAIGAILGLAFLPKLLGRRSGVKLIAGAYGNDVTYMGKTQPVEDAVASILPYLQIIWHSEGDNLWTSWDPVFPSDLVTVVHGRRCVVHVTEDCFWSW